MFGIEAQGSRGRQRFAFLQQLDRDVVGRTDEGHVAVARRAVDGDAGGLELRAQRVDVVDLVREVAEGAADRVRLRVPVVRQLDLRVFVAGRGEEDEREPPFLVLDAPHFLQAEQAA